MLDFRDGYWGHTINFKGEGKIKNAYKVYGFCSNPCMDKGDVFLYEAKKGLAVWRVITIAYESDPHDMFWAEVGIVRYAAAEDIENIFVYKGFLV